MDTNFYICFRDPTPIYDDQLKVKWKPVEPNITNFLKIDVDLQMVNEDLDRDRMAFWDSLYSLVLSLENTSSEINEKINTNILPFSLITSAAIFLGVCILVRYKHKKSLPEYRNLI